MKDKTSFLLDFEKFYNRNQCIACDSDIFDHLVYSGDFYNEDMSAMRHVFICRNCGLAYTYPFLTEAEEKSLYEDYPAHHTYENCSNNKTRLNLKLIRNIERLFESVFFKPNAVILRKVLSSFIFPRLFQCYPLFLTGNRRNLRFLDVGCGDGEFLMIAKKFNFVCYGIECQQSLVQKLRKSGINAATNIADFLPETNGEDGCFDIIRFNHVLEHIKNPSEILRVCNKLLKTNGELIIGIPNFKTFARIMGSSCWLHLPYHRQHFTKKSITELLKKCGFKVTYIKTRSIGIFAESLKRRFPFMRKIGLINVIDLIISPVIDALGYGDCIEVYAVRI